MEVFLKKIIFDDFMAQNITNFSPNLIFGQKLGKQTCFSWDWDKISKFPEYKSFVFMPSTICIKLIFKILLQSREKCVFYPIFCQKCDFWLKLVIFWAIKSSKMIFFFKNLHKKLDIHEIFHFSPYLDY